MESYVSILELKGRQLAIFYGSQTGTAEELAGRLAKDAARFGRKALVLDPEEIDVVCCCL
jgi:NADPH-ferrihemoprotein reductase